jgi:hypothetical protein
MKKVAWGAICAGIGAIIGAAIGDVLSVSHAIGMVLAGLGGGLGALVGGYIFS